MSICAQCGNEFKPQYKGRKYCTGACYYASRHGAGNPCFKGGSVTVAGYRELRVDGKRILEHRHVMQQHLGRPLETSEHVHHIDGNKLNNTIENLQLTTNSEHQKIHYTGFRNETHKQCSKCGEIKPRTEFPKGHIRAGGDDPNFCWCKTCRRNQYLAYRDARQTTYHKKRAAGWSMHKGGTWYRKDATGEIPSGSIQS